MDDSHISAAKSRYADIAVLVLAIACGALLWMNHALQKHNRVLIEQFRNLAKSQGPPVGSKISLLRGQTISGQNSAIDLSHRENETLLLVLSPVCPYSKANFHNWRDLLPSVSSSQVVWVDLSGMADASYLASVGIPANANVIRLNPEERTLYSLNVTPTTVLLGPHGTVRGVWPGFIGEEQANELRGLLRFPGA